MKFGIAFAPASSSISAAELARAVEARGFSVLLASEHTHVPVALTDKNPTGGDVPAEYRQLHDQMIWLAAAAIASSDLLIGTGICLVAQHDPILLAKQVVTLDHLSAGRMLFGFGYGWQLAEAANHGIDPRKRRSIAREKVLALKELWTADVAEFAGEYVSITPSWFGPKPVQAPHPPVFLGSSPGPRSFEHIAEFCNGWLMRYESDPVAVARLREVVAAHGRDPASVRLAVHRAKPEPGSLEAQFAQGAEFVTLGLEPGSRDQVLYQLDALAAVADQVR
jgi:probable F420-dependent oxidoreductase